MQHEPKHSDQNNNPQNDAHQNAHPAHESPIKTPKQLITVIVLSFLVPIIIILLLANYVNFGGKGNNAKNSEAATAKRIAPIAELNYVDAAAPVVYKTGEQVYQAVCLTCHDSGAAGAPKLGDVSTWAPRMKQGLDGLVHSVLNGKGAMAARAGTSSDDYSDYELTRAVVYMANKSGGNLTEPAEPAAANAPASSTEPAAASTPTPTPMVTPPAAAVATAAVAAPAASAAAPAPVAKIDGQKIYEQACIACHSAGVAGAPKFADKAAWAPRIAKGADALYASVLNGKGAMPAKGGHTGSDDEVKAAVDYMINAAK